MARDLSSHFLQDQNTPSLKLEIKVFMLVAKQSFICVLKDCI